MADSETRRVILVRHCEAGVGEPPDWDLTERGYLQAGQLAQRLQPLGIDRVLCSPYRRARNTIAPFLIASGLPLNIDERLMERRMPPSRFPTDDEYFDYMRRSFAEPDYVQSGCESCRHATARGWAAIEDALASEAALPALVGHGQLFSLVLSRVDPNFGYEGWRAMTNPDVFLIERLSDGALSFERIWQTAKRA